MGGRFLKGENLFYKKLKFNHIKFKTDKSCFLSVSSVFFYLNVSIILAFTNHRVWAINPDNILFV